MARRKIYSNLTKVGQYRPNHVDGQTLYKVFQCLNPDCTEIITVKKDDIDEDYSIICPKCGYEHYSGGEQHLFDFSMDVNNDNGKAVSVQEGEFVVSHDRKNDGCHLLGHKADDIHVAQPLRRFLFVIGLEHRIELHRNGAGHPNSPA